MQAVRAAIPILYRSAQLDGTIVDCNRYYATRLGYSMEEVIGSTVMDHSPASCHDEIRTLIETWKTKPVSNISKRTYLLTKTGETISVFRNSRPRMEGGQAVGIDSDLRDAAAIKNIQDIYNTDARADYEHPHILRRSVDYMGTIVACNQSYLDALGYIKDEVIGISLYEHTAPRSVGNLRANMENWRAGYRDAAKIWMRRKAGSEFLVLLTSADEKDQNGLVIGRTVSLEIIDS